MTDLFDGADAAGAPVGAEIEVPGGGQASQNGGTDGTLPERVRTIEEELAEQGVYYGTTTGDSMEPLLHHRRQTIVLKPFAPGARAVRGDVILVKREDGHYVLHRVVRVLPLPEGGYLTRGDNRLHRDLPVPEEQVLARFDGYYHGTEFVPVDSARYRAYVWFWVKNPCRFAYLAARSAVRRVTRGRKRK